MPKLVLFDCDGTLVDSQHMIVAAANTAFRASGLECPAQDKVLEIVGLSLPQAFSHLCREMPHVMVDDLVAKYKAAYAALRADGLSREPLFPGAQEIVEKLACCPGVRLGIVTGKSRRGLKAVLAHHRIAHLFQVLRTADDCPSKPNPAMVVEAMQEVGVAPQATVVVGDTSFDMAMARAAGAQAIGVAWGYHAPMALTGAGAHIVIKSYDALSPALEDLWARKV